jgi:hypothetical protein
MDLSMDSLSQEQINLIQKVTDKLRKGDVISKKVNDILENNNTF